MVKENRLEGDYGFWRDDFSSLKVSLRVNGIPSARLSAYQLTDEEWETLKTEHPQAALEMMGELEEENTDQEGYTIGEYTEADLPEPCASGMEKAREADNALDY